MNYRFCPQCGSKLIKKDDTEYACAKRHAFYNNPKAASSVFVINKDKQVLLAVRGVEPKKGRIDTIGGFLEFNENPERAAWREVKEETGVEVRLLDIIGAYTAKYTEFESATGITHVAEIISGEPKPQDDVAELRWYDLDNLPQIQDYAWSWMPDALKKLKIWVEDNTKPTSEIVNHSRPLQHFSRNLKLQA